MDHILSELSTITCLSWVALQGIAHCFTELDKAGGSKVKASASNEGDPGSIPVSGRFPGEGKGNPLQYSCLENPMDGEAW